MDAVPRPVDLRPGDAFKGKEEPFRMIRRPGADRAGEEEETKGSRLAGNRNPLHAFLPGARAIPRGAENTDLRACG
jgi:hypothetical protein